MFVVEVRDQQRDYVIVFLECVGDWDNAGSVFNLDEAGMVARLVTILQLVTFERNNDWLLLSFCDLTYLGRNGSEGKVARVLYFYF